MFSIFTKNIIYEKCAFIRLVVDGENLITKSDDRKGIIVWDELKKTRTETGDFLLLTCVELSSLVYWENI